MSDSEQEEQGAMAGPILTPPPSVEKSRPKRSSPPQSAYDPHLKCLQQAEDEEMAAVAVALNRSVQKPEDVVPDQLVPTDDLTLVHIQPGVS